MAKKVNTINQFGDHACPYCGCMFIESLGTEVKPGKMKCRICLKVYEVDKKTTKGANENKGKYAKACGKIKKEIDKERGTK